MTRYLVSIGLTVFFQLLIASDTYACSCVKPEVPKAFREARLVFVGEVTEIIQPHTNRVTAPPADRLFRIRFKIERSWKGASTQEVVILSDQGRAGCFSWGPFVKGRKYLVYAERRTPSGSPIKNLAVLFRCNRTELVENATEDLKTLEVMRRASGQKLGSNRYVPPVPSLDLLGTMRGQSPSESKASEFNSRVPGDGGWRRG